MMFLAMNEKSVKIDVKKVMSVSFAANAVSPVILLSFFLSFSMFLSAIF